MPTIAEEALTVPVPSYFYAGKAMLGLDGKHTTTLETNGSYRRSKTRPPSNTSHFPNGGAFAGSRGDLETYKIGRLYFPSELGSR